MTGLSFSSSLFPKANQYADDGSLISTNSQEYAGKYKTQVIATNTAVGAVTATVYTVPAGYVFFLSHYNLSLCVVAGSSPAFYLRKNGAATIIAKFQYVTTATDHSDVINAPLSMPLRFVAGDTIDIQTDTATAIMVGNIMGWLENA